MYRGNPNAAAFRCRGRPLCLPSRIAPALKRDAVSYKLQPKSNLQNSTPKSAIADSPPPAGDRCAAINLWPSGSYVLQRRERIKNQTKRRVCRFGLLCPPRAGVDTRPAWPGVDCAGRHRGLPLRAA